MQIKESELTKEVVQTLFKHQLSSADVEFGFVTIPAGERLPAEGTTFHKEHEYSFIVHGVLKGESGGKPFQIKAGEASYIPAGEAHWCLNEGDSPCELVFALVKN